MKKLLLFVSSALLFVGASCGPRINQVPVTPAPETNVKAMTEVQRSVVVMKTNKGDITIELFNDLSPKTVENFLKLSRDGFYNGTRFHRVIKDFMIQGGDPQSKDVSLKSRWGTGGPGYQFADEFNTVPLVRGNLAMANSGPNTNGSQFFIVTLDATPWLDGKHTNFGRVIDGMTVVDAIEGVSTNQMDQPTEEVIINTIEVK